METWRLWKQKSFRQTSWKYAAGPNLYHPLPKYFRSGGNVTRRFLGSTVTVSNKCWAQFSSNWSRKTWWWPPGNLEIFARTRPSVWLVVFWFQLILMKNNIYSTPNKCKKQFPFDKFDNVISWDVTPGAPGAGTYTWDSPATVRDTPKYRHSTWG